MIATLSKGALLRLIAETGYNVGYSAKKHLATFDMVEKLPGWIGLASLAVGIYSLFIPALEEKQVAAAFIVIGVASMFINTYSADKERYHEIGSELTRKFHELHVLYHRVGSQLPDADMSEFLTEHGRIHSDSLGLGVAKHIFLSDWYAHYKFFWQAQTDWMDEQIHFRLVRDKLPLSFTVVVSLVVIGSLIYLGYHNFLPAR